jgi:DNA (cytosine-5)-methyltransferase 1
VTTAETIQVLEQVCARYKRSEIAEMLGMDPKTITRWRTGITPPPSYLMPALLDILRKGNERKTAGQFSFIDLFAGIGGIRLGFEAHGGKCVFTSEWNPYSQKTYRENFGEEHEINGDITQVTAAEIPDHDVLLAGFPCQPFSIAGVSKKNSLGRPHGFECATQGTLFFDIARIIAEKRPKAFLLENVKNLRSHDKGNTFRVILDTLQNELGYHVQWRIIDAKHLLPQHRERILIVGFREDAGFDFEALKLPPVSDGPRLKSILHSQDGNEFNVDAGRFVGSNGDVLDKYTLTPRLWEYLQEYAAKHKAKGNGFGFSLCSGDDVARTLSARYYKDGSEILIRTGEGTRPRRLTPRECARLMGFSDDFKIPVSDMQAYKQFGNSVAVPVMKAVAGHMAPHIMELINSMDEIRAQQRLFGT